VAKFVALLASGVAQGAIVSLAALGFLLIYKATGVVNFAQGDLITLGAYFAIWASQDEDLPIVLAYVVALVLMFVVGVVMERLAYAPLRGRSVHVVVIATLGAALVLRTAIGLWQGSAPKTLDSPARGKVWHVAGAAVAYQRVVIVVVTSIVAIAMIALFRRTQFGRQVRAIAADMTTARLCGIPVRRLSMLAWGLSAVLAGIAGILIAPLGATDLTLGFGVMLGGFAAAILGGFGSLTGVLAGGVLIGLAEQLFGGYVGQEFKAAYPYLLMILVIAVRPQGLFTPEVHERL
jgi:branched-chain amino acid transport system permease protein